MKVGVIGLGHVGQNVVLRLRARGVEVVEYDIATGASYPHRQLSSCDFVTICVGTPAASDGSAQLQQVLDAACRAPVDRLLLRSTVPPGTTEWLIERTGKDICFSPEYVGETLFSRERWHTWAGDQLFQVLGGTQECTRWFAARLTEIHGPETEMFQCRAVEAEIIKYMENSYFALKVTFVNEFFDLCEALHADWFTVREGWLLDPRVERDHTAVFPESRGFGGRCLPKDVSAIIAHAQQQGVNMDLMRAVRRANELYRRDSS